MEITKLSKSELLSHTSELISDLDKQLVRIKQERNASLVAAALLIAITALN